MRLEIIIPDDTLPALKSKLASLTQRLSAQPELVEEIYFNSEDENITLTPEQVALIRKGQAEIKAGKFLTSEQVKAELAANRAAWQAANPH